MLTSKEIRKRLEAAGVYPDKVVKRGDTIEVKVTYFYHHGRTAEGWADTVARALGITATGRDDWRAWPKDSHLVAIIPA